MKLRAAICSFISLCVLLAVIALNLKVENTILSVRDGADLILKTCGPNPDSTPISLDGPNDYAGYVLNEHQIGENQKTIHKLESYIPHNADEGFYYYRLYEQIIDDLETGESHEVTYNFYAVKISNGEIFQKNPIETEWMKVNGIE